MSDASPSTEPGASNVISLAERVGRRLENNCLAKGFDPAAPLLADTALFPLSDTLFRIGFQLDRAADLQCDKPLTGENLAIILHRIVVNLNQASDRAGKLERKFAKAKKKAKRRA